MNQKLKNKREITLIALVVTIVVLLILAGVSISLILDNNGIIQKSKDAKLETRASQVEDEIGLWKQNNNIATTFEKAYIRYNNEIIDITDTIRYFEEKKCNYLASRSVGSYLVYLGKMESRHDICYTNQLIIIIKNDKLYAEEINMGYWLE